MVEAGSEAGSPADAFDRLVAELCEGSATLLCERADRCGCDELGPFPTGEACRAALRDRCTETLAPMRARVVGGSLHVDPAAAAACLEAYRAVPSCSRPEGAWLDAACSSVFVAPVPLGGDCDEGTCAGGAGTCVEGRCQPRPGEGDACSPSRPCMVGLRCLDGRCRTPVGEGDACSRDAECAAAMRCLDGRCGRPADLGASCDAATPCRPGLRCIDGTCALAPRGCPPGEPDTCGPGAACLVPNERRCTARQPAGASCRATPECEDGTYCDGTLGQCRALPGEGEPCGDGVHCAEGLACGFTSGRCEPMPGSGEPCALGERGPTVCAEGLTCLRTDSGPGGRLGTCGPPPESGEPCAADGRCASGLGCDFGDDGTNTCVDRREAGEPCATDLTCRPEAYCDLRTGQCAARRGEGEPCRDGNECAEGLACQPTAEGDWRCAALPAEGERCIDRCAPPWTCRLVDTEGRCVPDICRLPVGPPGP